MLIFQLDQKRLLFPLNILFTCSEHTNDKSSLLLHKRGEKLVKIEKKPNKARRQKNTKGFLFQ